MVKLLISSLLIIAGLLPAAAFGQRPDNTRDEPLVSIPNTSSMPYMRHNRWAAAGPDATENLIFLGSTVIMSNKKYPNNAWQIIDMYPAGHVHPSAAALAREVQQSSPRPSYSVEALGRVYGQVKNPVISVSGNNEIDDWRLPTIHDYDVQCANEAQAKYNAEQARASAALEAKRYQDVLDIQRNNGVMQCQMNNNLININRNLEHLRQY